MEKHNQQETNLELPLDAESTEHLETVPGTERVVGTRERDPLDERRHETRTDRFRRPPSMRPVGIDVLPTP